MMSLIEAIEHCNHQAESLENCECAEQHRQLGKWLQELSVWRKTFEGQSADDILQLIERVCEIEEEVDKLYADQRFVQMLEEKGVINIDEALDYLDKLLEARIKDQLLFLPCKQYTTIYYISDDRVYVGWYLAKCGETTNLICTDKIELGVCWVSDGYWFLTEEDAEIALESLKAVKTCETAQERE